MSAQRASGPARLAAFAAAAVLVVLAVSLAVRLAGQREPVRPPESAAPPPEGRTVDLKERVRHEEYEAGRLVAEVRGDKFFLGPDGLNHLQGSVEVVTFGPAGETVSRLAADEVVYDPGSSRFSFSGHVRVEAGGIALEGDRFDYDKAAGTFGTEEEGRFASRTMTGRAKGILYSEGAGEIRLGASLRLGYFAQQALDLLDPDLTVAGQLERDFPHESIGTLRNLAGAFQFSGDDIDKRIRSLSGGEKTRLVMARMLLDPPNFLVLDEPTNHLDLATKEMLVEALSSFDGTMLFVSHDRMFLRGLSNRVLELGGESGHDAQPHAYPGSYVEYVQRTGHEAPGVHA